MEHLLILWDSLFFHFFNKCLLNTYYMSDTIVGDKAVKRNIVPWFCLYSAEETVSQMHTILGSDKF